MNKKDFGEKLKNMRISSGKGWDSILSALDSEYGIKIARSTIYGYEHGRNYPDPDVFMALSNIYGCNDVMKEFGFSVAHDTGYGFEEIVLFEDEYSSEHWKMIKDFVSLIPPLKP